MKCINTDISKNNKRIINESIEYAKIEYPKVNVEGVWVCVGSRATNINHNNSDIDLLFFSEELSAFNRFVGNCNSIRVSVCAAPITLLDQDSREGTCGGYFAAKLISPYYLVGSGSLQKNIISAPANYFYPYISYIAQKNEIKLSIELVTSIAIISFMNICPEYESFFLKHYINDNFLKIWDLTTQQFEQSMKQANIRLNDFIKPDDNVKNHIVFKDFQELHRDSASRMAKHCSFCIKTHNLDVNFYQEYSDKSKKFINKHGGYNGDKYKNMINFLTKTSGLRSIDIK